MLEIIQSLTAIIALIISVCTLKQNSKQIEESTRPYITVYIKTINLGTPYKMLIIKNFGKSAGKINTFKCDYNLSKISYLDDLTPFNSIQESTLVPNQSYKSLINPPEENLILNFQISYTSTSNIKYNENISIKVDANKDNAYSRYSGGTNKDMNALICSIQQLVEETL